MPADTHLILWQWDGDAMVPVSQRFASVADREFVVGQTYRMEVSEPRSQASHNHYFACINDAWLNLPETMAQQFPTAEHMRKYALVKSGHCDRMTIACKTAAEARRTVIALTGKDVFALVSCRGDVVDVFTAHSQSVRAMGKATFQKSKDDVLRVIGEMIGADPAQLGKAA